MDLSKYRFYIWINLGKNGRFIQVLFSSLDKSMFFLGIDPKIPAGPRPYFVSILQIAHSIPNTSPKKVLIVRFLFTIHT